MSDRLKKCNGPLCNGSYKSEEFFYKIKGSENKYRLPCRDCKHYNQQVSISTFEGYLKNLFRELKYNCKKRPKDISFNVTIDDIKEIYQQQEGRCALSDIEMTHSKMSDRKEGDDCYIIHRWNISVDRIDSMKGYEKDNIQLLCCIINRMKHDLPQADFIEICKMFL